MNWELIANLLLCLFILGIPVLFAVANVNYKPDNKKSK